MSQASSSQGRDTYKGIRLLIVVVALLFWSAGEGADQIELKRLRPESPFYLYSPIHKPMDKVAGTPGQWASLWHRICGCSDVPPAVDFDRHLVVVAALGQRTSGGFGIFIRGAERKRGVVEVLVEEVTPGNDCTVTTALTQPVDIAVMTKTSARVVFRHVKSERRCSS